MAYQITLKLSRPLTNSANFKYIFVVFKLRMSLDWRWHSVDAWFWQSDWYTYKRITTRQGDNTSKNCLVIYHSTHQLTSWSDVTTNLFVQAVPSSVAPRRLFIIRRTYWLPRVMWLQTSLCKQCPAVWRWPASEWHRVCCLRLAADCLALIRKGTHV